MAVFHQFQLDWLEISWSDVLPRNILDISWLRKPWMSFESYPTAIKEAVIAPALAPANRLIWLIIPSSSRACNKQEVFLRKPMIGDKWKQFFILQLLKILRTGAWQLSDEMAILRCTYRLPYIANYSYWFHYIILYLQWL